MKKHLDALCKLQERECIGIITVMAPMSWGF